MNKTLQISIVKKLAAMAITAAMVTMLFSGCGSAKTFQSTPTASSEAPAPVREDIRIAMESDPPTLHPFDHKSVTANYMNALTFNQLFRVDLDTLMPVPDLCEKYERTSDTEWLFKIYENVNFHDGSHMTSADVAASMEYARKYPTTKDYSSFWKSVEIVDEYTVKVTTDGPYALTLPNLTSIRIVPKALIDQNHDFGTKPIGSGPYRFVSQTLGESLSFEAFDGYFNAAHQPKIKHMTWRIIPEGSSRTIALETGEIDTIIEVEANDVERLDASDATEVHKVDGTRVNFFSMNNEVYPFNNKDFRRAMNAAIDREAVITVAVNGQGVKTTAQTPAMFEGASTANAQDYDIDKAKEYLAASGVKVEGLSFSCIVSNDTARRGAEVIQANLKELGINMEIVAMDYATLLSTIMPGKYETSVIGYTSSTMTMYAYGVFHSNSLNAANLARVKDAKVDELIDLAKTQIDDAERGETLKQLTEYLNEQSPFVSLYHPIVARATNSALKGFKVSAAGGMWFEDVYWAQ